MKYAAVGALLLAACSSSKDPCASSASNGVTCDSSMQDADVIVAGKVLLDTDTGEITGDRDQVQGIDDIMFTAGEAGPSVFAFGSLTVAASGEVHFIGSHAVALAAFSDITVDGIIDASGGCTDGTVACAGVGGGHGGPGDKASTNKDAGGCGPGLSGQCGGLGAGGVCSGGGGGGAGSAGTQGGNSGRGSAGGAGGAACSSITPLIGGSGGGRGPSSMETWSSGGGINAGGGGGGALQLTSFTSITITGAISANAAAGEADMQVAPGAGGGGRGTVLVEAPRVEISGAASVDALGGAGSEGIPDQGVGGAGGAGLVHIRATERMISGTITPAPTTSAW